MSTFFKHGPRRDCTTSQSIFFFFGRKKPTAASGSEERPFVLPWFQPYGTIVRRRLSAAVETYSIKLSRECRKVVTRIASR
eukprot:scaffold2252_cov150-Amphora_coffeaeformis.AAC.3